MSRGIAMLSFGTVACQGLSRPIAAITYHYSFRMRMFHELGRLSMFNKERCVLFPLSFVPLWWYDAARTEHCTETKGHTIFFFFFFFAVQSFGGML